MSCWCRRVRPWSRPCLWSGLPRSALRSLHEGQSFVLRRTFSEQDLVQFSALTGDSNPLHLDPDFAKTTSFSKPLVHGVLVNGLISALLGVNAPGCVLLKQDIRFPAPLYVGQEVLAQAKVQRVRLSIAMVSVTVQTREWASDLTADRISGQIHVRTQGSTDQTQESTVVLRGTVMVKLNEELLVTE